MRTQPVRRRLGPWMASALVVGNMIGSGVFLLPSSLAKYGPVSLVAWVFTAAGAVLLALVFARLARAYPETGGPYAYARRAFGDFVGFQTAWGYWIAVWAGNAAIAVAFVGYLAHFWHALGTDKPLAAGVGLAAIWALTAVNSYGVRQGGLVQVVTTAVKLVPLLLIAVGGLFFVESANFGPFNASGTSAFSAVTAAAALTLWSFIGLESATVPAEDVEDPERTIPRATMAGTVVTALIYILGTVAVLGLVPAAALATSTAPFADAADAAFGGWAADLVAAGAAISAFGALNGWILLQGQVPYAAARDGLFPRFFARTGRGGTPVAGLVVSSVLVTVLMVMNYNSSLVDQFTFIILLATLTTVIPYAYAAAAELVLLATDRAAFSGRRLARDAVIALLAFGYSVWAIAGAGYEVVYKGTLLIFAGMPVYAWLKYRENRTPIKAVGSGPESPAKAA
ncbi:Arginine/agmatine antiporter [Actinomadura sp. RB99]|uniref:amino acid permease n=1 Tax=Actinomadura sp. RB99 TaxID=2691577 RepID=UPI0016860DAF|nr:amino acid permease [Actinomadura sp. RB99]MBD2892484.1 Arginine/agmatine antiporter [Actinomadura sp. RB99]